jgi:hypothetical protein
LKVGDTVLNRTQIINILNNNIGIFAKEFSVEPKLSVGDIRVVGFDGTKQVNGKVRVIEHFDKADDDNKWLVVFEIMAVIKLVD